MLFYIYFIIKLVLFYYDFIKGTSEEHEFLLPVITHVTEQILLNSPIYQQKLVLKCDGLLKNKNVPKYVIKLLKQKYSTHIITSEKFIYDLHKWADNCLVMLLLLFHYYFIIILLLFYYYFIIILLLLFYYYFIIILR